MVWVLGDQWKTEGLPKSDEPKYLLTLMSVQIYNLWLIFETQINIF